MKQQIETLMQDYYWMGKEVDRLQTIVYGASSPMQSWGVAQYGIESTMPRGSSGKSHAELRDMDLREQRLRERLSKYESYIYALEIAADKLKTEKEKIVYDCLLD